MLVSRINGSLSNVHRIKLRKLSTGLGFTGLSNASSGLIISTIADNESAPTVYTQAGSTVEGITTLGTFAAPTATKCRFKEVSATNHKGVYELQFADARYAVAGARSLQVSIAGVSDLDECDFVIDLASQVDVASFGGALLTARRVPELGIADRGTASSISAAVLNIQSGHGYADNTIRGSVVKITGSAGYPQWRWIKSHVGNAFTLNSAPTVTPDAPITYVIYGAPASDLDTGLAVLAELDPMIVSGKFTEDAMSNGVNVTAMNGAALIGDGSEADPIRTENAPEL